MVHIWFIITWMITFSSYRKSSYSICKRLHGQPLNRFSTNSNLIRHFLSVCLKNANFMPFKSFPHISSSQSSLTTCNPQTLFTSPHHQSPSHRFIYHIIQFTKTNHPDGGHHLVAISISSSNKMHILSIKTISISKFHNAINSC